MIDVSSIFVFTCDQQIYGVALNIIWVKPTSWANFYIRIDGTNGLMIFVRYVHKLMANSNLETIRDSLSQ